MPGKELSQEKSQAKGQAKAKQGTKSSIAIAPFVHNNCVYERHEVSRP